MNALILVPTYNERENLPILVAASCPPRHARPRAGRRLTRWHRPDRRRARATVSGAPRRLASYCGQRGLGRSYRDGFLHRDRERRRRRVPDGRRPVTRSEVPAVADRGHGGRGSRHRLAFIPGGGVENWPFRRVMLSGFASDTYIRTVTGLRIHDCTGGFRCWRREALARIPLDRITSDGYSFLVEVAFHAAAAGASPNGRSCSSNAGWARRSCRAAC